MCSFCACGRFACFYMSKLFVDQDCTEAYQSELPVLGRAGVSWGVDRSNNAGQTAFECVFFFLTRAFPPSHTGISSLLPPDQLCSLSHSSNIYCFPPFQFITSCLFPPASVFSSPLTVLQLHSFVSFFPLLLFTACLMIHKKDTTQPK